MKAKFENCAARVLPAKASAAVCREIESFEKLPSLRELTKLLEPAGHAASDGRRMSVMGSGVA